MKSSYIILAVTLLAMPTFVSAQTQIAYTAMLHRFRLQSDGHSQVMMIAHYLTDINGPRLTNSPGYINCQ